MPKSYSPNRYDASSPPQPGGGYAQLHGSGRSGMDDSGRSGGAAKHGRRANGSSPEQARGAARAAAAAIVAVYTVRSLHWSQTSYPITRIKLTLLQ